MACTGSDSRQDQQQGNAAQEETVQAGDSVSAPAPADDEQQRASPLVKKDADIQGVSVSIMYGSPAVKNRTIWGDLVPYDKVWRTGANEATNITFSEDVMIEGKRLPKGRYAFFTVPSASSWTVIFNKEWDQWGAYEYDSSEDALRVIATPSFEEAVIERLEFELGAAGEGEGVIMKWEKLRLPIMIERAA